MTSGYRTRLAGINGAGPPGGVRRTEARPLGHPTPDGIPVKGPIRRSR